MTEQPQASDPVVGRTLDGRYRIDAAIASGGMATVYRATDVRLQRTVAVKIMHAHLATDPQFRERFLHEALAAARLSHPNIVNVYDQGHESGLWYLVMEYVPSMTLRDLIRQRRSLDARQALGILSPALAGLAAAHESGILHRDLKPENILISQDGRVKIADFGLARALSAHTSPTQNLIGSVAYMSPELLARGNADARSDVYAMGIILYEMLVGQRPFRGQDAMQIALQHANDPVPAPSDSVATVPTEVDELVQWATAKRPEDRAPSARLLQEQADDVRAALPPAHEEPMETLPFPRTAPTRVLAAQQPVASTARLTETVGTGTAAEQTDVGRLQELGARRRRRGGLLLLIVLVLAGIAGGTGWYFGSGPGAMIAVPDVHAMARAEAIDALHGAGFATEETTANDLDVPDGHVIGTEPPGGASEYAGGTVTVTISSGPASVTVPSVLGANEDLARSSLTQAGFAVADGATEVFSPTIPSRSVVALSSSGSTVKERQTLLQGTEITLTVSLGAIPDVTNQTVDAATATLTGLGLKVDASDQEFSDTVPSGSVIAQKNAKKTMKKGSTVVLVVSKGEDLIAVPSGLTGASVAAASAALQAAGFAVTVDNDWLPDAIKQIATVTRVDPGEGSQLKRGANVTIYWSYTG